MADRQALLALRWEILQNVVDKTSTISELPSNLPLRFCIRNAYCFCSGLFLLIKETKLI